MSDHDPLCHYEVDDLGPVGWCDCTLIAKVRADERDRVGEMGIRAARKGAAIAALEWKAAFRAKAFASPLNFWTRDDVLALIDGEQQ